MIDSAHATPRKWIFTILAALCFGFIVVIPFEPNARKKVELFRLEVTASGATSGFVQLFYDIGGGFSEIDSVRILVEPSNSPVVYRFPIPSATYRLLRFDPIDHEETVTFSNFRIVDGDGAVVRTFESERFEPYNQIAALNVTPQGIQVVPTPGAGDPVLIVKVDRPFKLSSPKNYAWASHLRDTLIVAAVLVGLIQLFRRASGLSRRVGQLSGLIATHPCRIIGALALFSTVFSAYPVVFLGKSFVSPNFGSLLLYDQMPTLPGYRDTTLHEVGASDVGAIMWHHIPHSMVQHDALLRDFELPLWNRYNSSGNTALGQGQTSFGDPLQILPILGNGRAWAWDLKFLLSKWFFALGLGLVVWTALENRGLQSVAAPTAARDRFWAAALVSLLTSFIGFFIFRVNHPAFFSLCYSPWIAYAWLRILQSVTWQALLRWLSFLILANWAELTSGTAKEAIMLLLGMNFTGFLLLLTSELSLKAKMVRFVATAVAGVAFIALSSPLWLTFLQSLAKSYTSYDAPRVYQLQPGLLLTLFDEIFTRAFMEKQKVLNGSLNFLLFFGVSFAVVRIRILWTNRVFRGFALAAVAPLLLLFGAVPPEWITHVPLLGNIGHLDNTLICVLIIQLSALAGYGFWELFSLLRRRQASADLAWSFVIIAVVVAMYLGTTQAVQRTSRSYLRWGELEQSTPVVYAYLGSLLGGLVVFAVALRHLITKDSASIAARIFLVLGFLITTWRMGWHVGNGFEDYVVHPTARANFHAKSKALAPILADDSGPFRVAGMQGNMFPGWSGVYHLEGICGPDALMNLHYRQLTEAAGVERVWDWRFVLEPGNLASQRPLYDFLGVKYYFDRRGDQGERAKTLTPILMADLEVYRSETAWPRAFFSRKVAPYSSVQELGTWIKMRPSPFISMDKKDAEEAGLSSLLNSDRSAQQIALGRDFKLTVNKTKFIVDASGPGVAALHESFVPGDFRVSVDGKPATVLRVNHAFKGVHIMSAGTHVIEFEYWPEHLTATLVLSFGAAAAWLLACFLAPKLPSSWLPGPHSSASAQIR